MKPAAGCAPWGGSPALLFLARALGHHGPFSSPTLDHTSAAHPRPGHQHPLWVGRHVLSGPLGPQCFLSAVCSGTPAREPLPAPPRTARDAAVPDTRVPWLFGFAALGVQAEVIAVCLGDTVGSLESQLWGAGASACHGRVLQAPRKPWATARPLQRTSNTVSELGCLDVPTKWCLHVCREEQGMPGARLLPL